MMNDVRKIVIDALARIVAEKRIRAQAQSDLSNAEEALRAEMSREGE
jgi:hypothetical protein